MSLLDIHSKSVEYKSILPLHTRPPPPHTHPTRPKPSQEVIIATDGPSDYRHPRDHLAASASDPVPSLTNLPVWLFTLLLLVATATLCLDNLFVVFLPHPPAFSSSSQSPSTSNSNPDSSSSPSFDRSQWTALQPPASRQPIQFQVLDPSAPTASLWTILAIHGLASLNASDAFHMRHALLNINKDLFGNARFVIPFAPTIPVDVRGGEQVPAWFNIHNWNDMRDQEDGKHMQQNVGELVELVTRLKLDMSRTIFLGFSQGAVMSLLLSLNLAQPPIAVVMLSAFLPVPNELPQLISSSAVGISSLLWLHGILDPYFKLPTAKLGVQSLRSLGFFKSAKLESIPELGHGFDMRELVLVVRWLERFMS